MGCNCKELKDKKEIEEIYKGTVSVSRIKREKIKFMILFIILSPIFLVSSIIKLLTNGKKLQNKG
jgi:hypothetical protein